MRQNARLEASEDVKHRKVTESPIKDSATASTSSPHQSSTKINGLK
jgi:hypothetical protein